MTPERWRWVAALGLWGALAGPRASWADDDASGSSGGAEDSDDEGTPDQSLEAYRTPFEALVESTLGSASRPVEFNWRKGGTQVGVGGTHLYELNNFNSLRLEGFTRLPSRRVLVELGLGWVFVWDTDSSEMLALTPYRQTGRPQRLELEAVVALPVAEGIVTASPRFFPPVEMVWSLQGGLRYMLYPTAFRGLTIREAIGATLAPRLSDQELDNLEDVRLEAMKVDRGRYVLLAGFGNDLYFHSGVFVTPRAMFALPIVAPATDTALFFWAEFSLAAGMAL